MACVEFEVVEHGDAGAQTDFVQFQRTVPAAFRCAGGKGAAQGVEAQVIVSQGNQRALRGQVQVVERAVGTQVEVSGLKGAALRLPEQSAVSADRQRMVVQTACRFQVERRGFPVAAGRPPDAVALPAQRQRVVLERTVDFKRPAACFGPLRVQAEVFDFVAALRQAHIDTAAFDNEAVGGGAGGLLP